MTNDETIDSLWERSNHGTRREDIEAAYNAGVEAEREECAKLCEALPRMGEKYEIPGVGLASNITGRKECADAIRMRSNAFTGSR